MPVVWPSERSRAADAMWRARVCVAAQWALHRPRYRGAPPAAALVVCRARHWPGRRRMSGGASCRERRAVPHVRFCCDEFITRRHYIWGAGPLQATTASVLPEFRRPAFAACEQPIRRLAACCLRSRARRRAGRASSRQSAARAAPLQGCRSARRRVAGLPRRRRRLQACHAEGVACIQTTSQRSVSPDPGPTPSRAIR